MSQAPAPTLQKVRFTHDAVIDEILLNPAITQRELAKMFGFTEGWMSIIVNSDAFKERLADRKGELVDPAIRAGINDRLDAVARRSLDKILERLDSPMAGSIKNGDLVAMAKLGVGDKNTRPAGPQVQQNLYVVSLPTPAENSQAWLNSARGRTPPPGGVPLVEEVPRG